MTAGPGRLWGQGRRAGPGPRGDEGGDPARQPHGWPAEPPSHVTTGKGPHEPRRVKRSGLSPRSNSAARPLASQGHCHTAAGAGTGSCRAGLSPSGGRRQSRSFRNRRRVCSPPPPAPGGAGWQGLRPRHSHLCLLSPGRRHRAWSPLHASMMSPHLNHHCKDLCCKQGPMLSFQVDADGGGGGRGGRHSACSTGTGGRALQLAGGGSRKGPSSLPEAATPKQGGRSPELSGVWQRALPALPALVRPSPPPDAGSHQDRSERLLLPTQMALEAAGPMRVTGTQEASAERAPKAGTGPPGASGRLHARTHRAPTVPAAGAAMRWELTAGRRSKRWGVRGT